MGKKVFSLFVCLTLLAISCTSCYAISWSDQPSATSTNSTPATTKKQQPSQQNSSANFKNVATSNDLRLWAGIGAGYSFGSGVDTSFDFEWAPWNDANKLPFSDHLQTSPGFTFSAEIGVKSIHLGCRAKWDYVAFSGTNTITPKFTIGGKPFTDFSVDSSSAMQNAYYLQAMGFLPFAEQFDAYGAIGLGAISASLSTGCASYTGKGADNNTILKSASITKTAFAIPLSIGGDWNFAQNFAANLDLTYIISTNSDNASSMFMPTVNIKFIY